MNTEKMMTLILNSGLVHLNSLNLQVDRRRMERPLQHRNRRRIHEKRLPILQI
jgi:hypothetical protein